MAWHPAQACVNFHDKSQTYSGGSSRRAPPRTCRQHCEELEHDWLGEGRHREASWMRGPHRRPARAHRDGTAEHAVDGLFPSAVSDHRAFRERRRRRLPDALQTRKRDYVSDLKHIKHGLRATSHLEEDDKGKLHVQDRLRRHAAGGTSARRCGRCRRTRGPSTTRGREHGCHRSLSAASP